MSENWEKDFRLEENYLFSFYNLAQKRSGQYMFVKLERLTHECSYDFDKWKKVDCNPCGWCCVHSKDHKSLKIRETVKQPGGTHYFRQYHTGSTFPRGLDTK